MAFGEKILSAIPSGVFVGMLNSSSEAVVVTEQGTAIKTLSATVRRFPESEDRILGIRDVPWSPDGSDNGFDIQVGIERPAEKNRVARTYLRRADFERWGLSEGMPWVPIPENWSGATTSSQREACQEED